MVQVIWLVVAVFALFSVGYLGYSKYLAQFVELDDSRDTPAHKYEDGQEYVPAKKPVLLGHHFSSIAGGAPIVGPITAGVVWGWVPALAWIAIGNPLMGSVHDFTSLSASMRHDGKSIGYIIGEYVGERGKDMLLWFAFITIILVVAVFALVVAIVFDAYPQAATASLIYIGLAVLFGAYLYQLDLPFIPGTAAFVAAMFAGVWVGVKYPLALLPAAEGSSYPAGTIVLLGMDGSWLPAAGAFGANAAAWIPVILVYGALASALPVWVLLQPRDYLSSFLLYTGVGGALLAVIVGTVGGALGVSAITSSQPLVTNLQPYYGFIGRGGLPLFPMLFITIACGTISGFHSLVSSGTTSKQLNKESDARTIGYGGMLGEGLLATVALITVALVSPDVGSGIGLALPTFATGGGILLTSFGIPTDFGAPFMALVLVSFLLTSTDTAVRLGRYMMEEIVGTPESSVETFAADRYGNAGLQCLAAYVLIASGSWTTLWALFGGANQLLAALALLTATVWLANWSDAKQLLSTGGPMVVMVTITVLGLLWIALHDNIYAKFLDSQWMASADVVAMLSAVAQIVIAFTLIYLALSLVKLGYENIQKVREQPGSGEFTPGDD
ncbi:carbon starvation CstA family protein [Halopelagius longus]|uniref:Carbon starvation protein n=1 Tax=Halopelagius longus TaxID=1236180 RepID=A0A1H1EUY4_9EURY|nr:carbon starvation CstA family protein [Halopelagius longus]RDI71895.1 carbon starvation protein A [Halopelagius longus]SDQ92408.1 carbon starvation protein [Halopelagius longus]